MVCIVLFWRFRVSMALKLADEIKKAMAFPAPITSYPYAIEKQWIDYNGHFNMAYYNVLFDRDSDVALTSLGLGPGYVKRTGNSYFTLESHVSYLRELHMEDKVIIDLQVLDFDAKRLHYVQSMRHAVKGWIASVSECIVIHVNLVAKKSSVMPPDVLAMVQQAHEAHKALPIPSQVGHKIGISRKT